MVHLADIWVYSQATQDDCLLSVHPPAGPVLLHLHPTHRTDLPPQQQSLISKYLHNSPTSQLVVIIFRSEWLPFDSLTKGRPPPQEDTQPKTLRGLCLSAGFPGNRWPIRCQLLSYNWQSPYFPRSKDCCYPVLPTVCLPSTVGCPSRTPLLQMCKITHLLNHCCH